MHEQLEPICCVILAKHSEVGKKYYSRKGRQIIVKEKRENKIIVESLETGNDVSIPLHYPLRPVAGEN